MREPSGPLLDGSVLPTRAPATLLTLARVPCTVVLVWSFSSGCRSLSSLQIGEHSVDLLLSPMFGRNSVETRMFMWCLLMSRESRWFTRYYWGVQKGLRKSVRRNVTNSAPSVHLLEPLHFLLLGCGKFLFLGLVPLGLAPINRVVPGRDLSGSTPAEISFAGWRRTVSLKIPNG